MNPFVCSCKHPRTSHSQGAARCYSGGHGAAWCKCQAYDGPKPCKICRTHGQNADHPLTQSRMAAS